MALYCSLIDYFIFMALYGSLIDRLFAFHMRCKIEMSFLRIWFHKKANIE